MAEFDRWNNDKVKVAKKVVETAGNGIPDIHDLKDRVDGLVDFIKESNGLKK